MTEQSGPDRYERGKQLRAFRESRGLGIRAFARVLGWRPDTLAGLEKGRQYIGAKRRAEVARSFSVGVGVIWPEVPEAERGELAQETRATP